MSFMKSLKGLKGLADEFKGMVGDKDKDKTKPKQDYGGMFRSSALQAVHNFGS